MTELELTRAMPDPSHPIEYCSVTFCGQPGCGRTIYQRDGGGLWYHMDTGRTVCR